MRALIVEDSKLDRDALKAMLQRVPGVSVAGEAATMEAARQALKESAADVVFLDIEIGSGNGFDLLADIRGRAVVVFTTVHTGHGGRAFDADAVDYIVKPVAEDRLLRALQRAAKALNSDIRGLERVPVHRSGSERQLIALESVSAVLAEGNYSCVVSGYRAYPDHRRLREWQKLLLDFPFERVDRSTLLRLDHVESVRPHGAGAVVSLRNGADPLELGRTARERLAALTGW